MTNIDNIIATAQSSALVARSPYARDVLAGYQAWSGADLKGKAKLYGSSYYRARCKAAKALYAAGGRIVPIEHGRLVTAVTIGVDDYGNEVVDTQYGARTLNERGTWYV